jgi:tetratricopeptide (TPR) repeat protein
VNANEEALERSMREVRRLSALGRERAAFELLRKAADGNPRNARLLHDTAELARRLNEAELAVSYYRKASVAFANDGFSRHAVAPLRSAWLITKGGLPGTAESFAGIASELVRLQSALGFVADAKMLLDMTEGAFEKAGLSRPFELSELRDTPALAVG